MAAQYLSHGQTAISFFKTVNPVVGISFHDVPKNRPVTHLYHGLGFEMGFL